MIKFKQNRCKPHSVCCLGFFLNTGDKSIIVFIYMGMFGNKIYEISHVFISKVFMIPVTDIVDKP